LNFELIQHSKLRTQNFKGRLTIDKKSPFAEKLTGFFVIGSINPNNLTNSNNSIWPKGWWALLF